MSFDSILSDTNVCSESHSKLIISDWQLEERGFTGHKMEAEMNHHATLFSLCNGNIGVRGALEEDTWTGKRATYMNAIFDSSEEVARHSQQHCSFTTNTFMVAVMDMTAINLFIGNEKFDPKLGKLLHHTRVLDLKKGIVTRKAIWRSALGKEIELETTRIVPFNHHHCAAIKYVVTPRNFSSSEITISSLDCLPTNGHWALRSDILAEHGDFSQTLLHARTNASQIDVMYGTTCECYLEFCSPSQSSASFSFRPSPVTLGTSPGTFVTKPIQVVPRQELEPNGVKTVFSQYVQDEKCSMILCKYCTYVSSRDVSTEDMEQTAKENLKLMRQTEFKALLREQEEFLANFWSNADVKVQCDDQEVQGTLRLNMLHLIMSAGRTKGTSFASKGLTGEAFGGQFSWDTEIYMLPFFVFAYPQVAKSMIQFRIDTLPQAMDRVFDFELTRGALYPNRTIDGTNTSSSNPSALPMHINADIAYGIKLYYDITEDIELMREGGAKVIFSTALFCIEWGTWDKGQFQLRSVTGPDEYNILVNNNYYTNGMTQTHLQFACELAEIFRVQFPEDWANLCLELNLNDEDIAHMKRAGEKMALPFDPHLKISLQDESFLRKKEWVPPRETNLTFDHKALIDHYHPTAIYRHRICKQADVILCQTLLRHKFTTNERSANFQFYDAKTARDSSLVASMFSVAASDLKLTAKAKRDFEQALYVDLKDRIMNTANGIHASAMAGSWAAVVQGFAGVSSVDGVIHVNPSLPEGWREISVNFRIRKTKFNLTVKKQLVQYTVLEGPKIHIMHNSTTRVHLAKGKPVAIRALTDLQSYEFDAVVFDLNAVLGEVQQYHYEAWKKILDPFFLRAGCEPLTHAQYLAYVRHHPKLQGKEYTGLQQLMVDRNITIPYGDLNNSPETNSIWGLANAKHAEFRRVIKEKGIHLVDGALRFFEDLKKNGVLIGCVTSSKTGKWLRDQTPLASITDHFVDCDTGLKMALHWKPDAQFFERCAIALDCTPKRTVIILDEVVGFSKESLQKFGYVAAREQKGTTIEELRAAGVHSVVADYTTLTTDKLDRMVEQIKHPVPPRFPGKITT